ncbi:MAG: hypothetical protein IKT95_05760 [Spirochaetales bacterium]|nr:hypothetical protein [Spirochaetales bacterium]
MKKRILLLVLLTILITGSLFSLDKEFVERVWAFNGTQATTINLSKTFYLPTYAVDWDDKSNDLINGTYLTSGTGANGIAHIGVASCTHSITFTVPTTGRFVSQSDPTKYRDFYVALKPRIREYQSWPNGGKDRNYYVDLYNGKIAGGSDRVPNTRGTNVVCVTTPAMPSFLNANQNNVDLSDLTKRIQMDATNYIFATRIYYDVLLCLDPITSQDMVHLARLDDYVAEINVSWKCNEANCDKSGIHNGQYTFVIRGYYGDANNEADNVFLLVTPEATASRVDIYNLINNEQHKGKERIATFKVITTTPTSNNDWKNLVKVFISSSYDYNVAGDPFVLQQYDTRSGTGDKSIPFTIKVYNMGYENTENFNREYDGTDCWRSASESSAMCLNFAAGTNNSPNDLHYTDPNTGQDYYANIINSYRERQGNTSIGMVYEGVVMIEIEDDASQGYPILNNKTAYSGLYKGDIYFHIVYNK